MQTEETYRDVRGRWFQDVGRDLRYGLRSLRRTPAFAIIALVSLGAGIGANTAIFSVVNSLLLRPRPVADPDRVVELYTGEHGRPFETSSYASYLELRDRNGVLSGLAAYSIWQFKVTDPAGVEQIWGEVISGNYFDVLGVHVVRGRPITEADEATPEHPVALIGHGLWQRRFKSDPGALGQTISINGQSVLIVGVVSPQFTGMLRGLASEVWMPLTALPALEPARGRARLVHRGNRWLTMIGRLEPDASIEQARARFDLLGREMQAKYPEEWRSPHPGTGAVRELFITVLPERDTRIHPGLRDVSYAVVALLVAIVNLVLLIACMNLANMLLTRGIERRKEVAIRLAVGAGRWRLVRQFIAESVLIALIAGLAGVVFSAWLLDVFLAMMPALPEGIRLAVDLQLDWRVLTYALVFSTATGVLFGLVPALHSSKSPVSAVLKDESNAATRGYGTSRMRKGLVVAQVAFSLVLLIATGLVLRSLDNVRPTRLGFSSEDVLVVPLTLDEAQYSRVRTLQFYRQLSERVSALPGVQAVSLAEAVPGGFTGRSRRSIDIEGYQPASGESREIDSLIVGPHYFTNMNVPLVQGRDFDERDRDGAPCAAIVNEVFARRYFPGAPTALGRRLSREESEPGVSQTCEIVGVIRDDAWQSLEKTVRPFFALAAMQSDRQRMSLLVHTAGAPGSQVDAVRRTIRSLDPNVPVNDVQTLRDYFSVSLYPFRVLGAVIGACGAMALLIATLGIYGVVSYSAAQRTREVGIRMALGALRHDVMRIVVGQGMTLVAIGTIVGLLISAAVTRVLASSIFETDLLLGVSPTDAVTFSAVTVLLLVVAAAACYIPARRASNVDPVRALRHE